ncbi:MAG: MFS transporter [Gammaproteobacteria bacterium]|nr:MFS transporter [Gammaproteobacteria bacterium]
MNLTSSEFRRGWTVLLAASLGTACGASPIPFNSIGPFTKPLAEEFGWGRGDIQLALFCFTAAVVLTVPYIGGLADRIGVRKVAIGTLFLFGVSWASLALTPASLPIFYLMFALVGALGGGSTPVSWTRGVNAWFVHNRGLALAITLLGTGITTALLPSLATWLIAQYGWRLAFVGIALLPLGIALPVVIRLFREPTAGEVVQRAASAGLAGASVAAALRNYRFWIIAFSVLCVSIGVGGSIANFQPLLIDRGFQPQEAAKVAGAIGLSVICGRLVAGYLMDRFWAPLVTLPMLALPAVACIVLARPEVPASAALLSAVLIGLAAGAETDLVAYLTARYFGLAHYGRIYGLQYSVFGFASGFAPFLFGRVFDRLGTYGPILHLAAALFVIGAVALLTLGRYPDYEAPSAR